MHPISQLLKLNFEKSEGGMMHVPGAALMSSAVMLRVSHNLYESHNMVLLKPLLTLISKITEKNMICKYIGVLNFFFQVCI